MARSWKYCKSIGARNKLLRACTPSRVTPLPLSIAIFIAESLQNILSYQQPMSGNGTALMRCWYGIWYDIQSHPLIGSCRSIDYYLGIVSISAWSSTKRLRGMSEGIPVRRPTTGFSHHYNSQTKFQSLQLNSAAACLHKTTIQWSELRKRSSRLHGGHCVVLFLQRCI
jgi:hypothetical protein